MADTRNPVTGFPSALARGSCKGIIKRWMPGVYPFKPDGEYCGPGEKYLAFLIKIPISKKTSFKNLRENPYFVQFF